MIEMNARCVQCGHEFGPKEGIAAQYTAKRFLRVVAGLPSGGMTCPNCKATGARNFVCAECGQFHMWRPGPCRRR